MLEDARQILTNKQQRKGEHPNERVLDESTRVKVTKTGGDEDPLEVSVWRTRLVKRREVDEEEQRRLEEDRGLAFVDFKSKLEDELIFIC